MIEMILEACHDIAVSILHNVNFLFT